LGKTLHLTNAWHESSGGIATYYRALAAEAKRRGREMILVVPGAEDAVESSGGVRRYSVKAGASPFNGAYRMIRPNAWPGVNRSVLKILREEAPDLVEVCDKYSLHYVAGLLRRGWLRGVARPLLLGLSCERMDDNFRSYVGGHEWGRAFVRFYMKWNYFGYFDHHVTVSEHTAAELREAGRGHIVSRGIFVRGMGVDLESFGPERRSETLRARLRAETGARHLLLYAGRLAPEKNLELLFAACRRLPGDYGLVVAGEGIEKKRWASQQMKRVLFWGYEPERERLAELYASCDAFVHPNPNEPFGIAPLEAMASGLALVAPDRGGVITYANEGNAWLAAPEAGAFAEAIRAAVEGGEREAHLSMAIKTAKKFSWPEAAARYFALYDRLIAGGPLEDAEYQSSPGNWLGWEG
jgi:alpha-1,6-mannosyltransferase